MTSSGGAGVRAADAHYDTVQAPYVVGQSGDYERLVTAWGNSQAPVHRWFHVKEAYSHQLLERVIKDVRLDVTRDSLTVHDPFGGSGTTLASAGDYARDRLPYRVTASAVEVNPFLHLLSTVKTNAYASARPDVLATAKRLVAAVTRGQVEPARLPELSTFANRDYFSADAIRTLLMLTGAIAALENDGHDPIELDALRVCLAAAIEPSSSLRRDGRALRFEANKQVAEPASVFLERAFEMHADWYNLPNFDGFVNRGDARTRAHDGGGVADLVLFSPPYPNNIDYTEVYKLENWLLGLIADQGEFTAQRRRTLRSHPSIKFEASYDFDQSPHRAEVRGLLDPICAAVPESRYREALIRTIYGYADDMLGVVRESERRLKAGGHLVYVVGNSYHGDVNDGVVVAADLIIARMCELVGLDVVSMDVARVPRRRRTDSSYLRETVVFARKPQVVA